MRDDFLSLKNEALSFCKVFRRKISSSTSPAILRSKLLSFFGSMSFTTNYYPSLIFSCNFMNELESCIACRKALNSFFPFLLDAILKAFIHKLLAWHNFFFSKLLLLEFVFKQNSPACLFAYPFLPCFVRIFEIWSCCSDKAHYHHTYGFDKAGVLRDSSV